MTRLRATKAQRKRAADAAWAAAYDNARAAKRARDPQALELWLSIFDAAAQELTRLAHR